VARSGYLDDTYFKRAPWTFGDNQTYGRLLVHDNRSVYCVRMFDSLKGLDPTVFFTPGARGYLLFARNLGGKQDVWSQRVPVRIRAMALASQRLVVAGPPDVIAARDPLGAFEGRLGGLLYVLETVSGRKLNERTLPSSPVFNGMAVANGRIYLADEAGCVSCLVSS
jgi:outer membrane protein assembly factor BamB